MFMKKFVHHVVSTIISRKLVFKPGMKHTDHMGSLTFHLPDKGINMVFIITGPEILVKPNTNHGFLGIKIIVPGFSVYDMPMVRVIKSFIGLAHRREKRMVSLMDDIVKIQKHIIKVDHSAKR